MFTFSFTMWIYEKYLLICKAVFMIYSPYLDSNGMFRFLPVQLYFSFPCPTKVSNIFKILRFMICRPLKCRENRQNYIQIIFKSTCGAPLSSIRLSAKIA
jgi:hypothetical protein